MSHIPKLETTTGEGITLLETGKHPVEISEIKVVNQPNIQTGVHEDRLQFTFKALQPDEDGAHGIISNWTRITRYQTSENPTASLTILLDQFFGRKMTKEEAENLNVGKLVGLRGFAVVGRSATGKVKFDSWEHPKNKEKYPLPEPKNFAWTQEELQAMEAERKRAEEAQKPSPPPPVKPGAGRFARGSDAPLEGTEDLNDPFAE